MSARSGVSRRRLLGTALVAGAASALPVPAGAEAASRRRRTKTVDVVVVGAGLAGLSAARELVKAGKSVVVLEAHSRVGGRTLNHDLGDGQVVEVGGQFVGPTQDRILALASDVDVKTYIAYGTGPTAYIANGQVTRYDPTARWATSRQTRPSCPISRRS